MQVKRTYTAINDPGHGWLSVPLGDVRAVGLHCLSNTEQTTRNEALRDSATYLPLPNGVVSSYSITDGIRAYLEEDCDMDQFLQAANRAGWQVTIRDSYCNRTRIRSLSGNLGDWINFGPARPGMRVRLHDGTIGVLCGSGKNMLMETDSGKLYHIPSTNPAGYVFPISA